MRIFLQFVTHVFLCDSSLQITFLLKLLELKKLNVKLCSHKTAVFYASFVI